MAIGQAVINSSSIAAGASLSIQPSGSAEWVIHNILVPEDVAIELYYYNGTTDTLIETTSGSYFDVHFHVINARYYKVKNVSAETIIIGYDGVITYE